MTRIKKPSGSSEMKTGDQFLQKAREAGARVSEKDSRGFHKISTPSGDMFMTGGTQPLDPRTRKNYKHWFKLLGLLGILWFLFTNQSFVQFLHNMYWIATH